MGVRLAKVKRRLPRHAHQLDRAEVEASQRWRILEAMVEVVSRTGHAAASVADVIERAGVSRKTFYEHFSGKEDCFLAAYQVLSERLIHDLEGIPTRSRQLHRFLEVLSGDLRAARVFMVEVQGAGPRALADRAEINRRFGAVFLRGLKLDPVCVQAVVGGINQVVAGALLERSSNLMALEAPLNAFVAAAISRR